ncbi:MAG: DUF6941 family protein [Verrucomicrobiota bacterium]
MNPARIIPDLQSSLLCDGVRQEANGNLIVLGVMGLIRVPQVPITAQVMFVLNRWTAGIGQFNETVRFMAPDQVTVLRKGEAKFALQDPAHSATNMLGLQQVEFKVPGVYWVEVLVDDVMKLRYPIPVVVVPPPGQPGAAPAQ